MVPNNFSSNQFHWQNPIQVDSNPLYDPNHQSRDSDPELESSEVQNELKSGSGFGSRAGIVTSLVQRETLVQSTHEVDNCLERASEQRVEAEEEE